MSAITRQERLMSVILGPHISEKSSAAAEGSNQIVLKVLKSATKRQIRAAVEMMFEVKVERVSVVNVLGKTKRFGRFVGQRSAWKKAYVRLAPGHDIDFAGAE